MKVRLAALAVCLVPLAACATMEPEPCTAEWIDYKTDKVLKKFAGENRGLINDLKRLAREDGGINPVTAMSLMGKTDKLRRFAYSFNDIVLPELQAAMDQCGQRPEFVPAFTEFLRKEGVNDEALEWVGPVIGLMQDMRNGEFDDATDD
ncbi:MAG: hypothetical protein R3C13_02150 [Hyphomonas sp.]|uniref:hypothetical protein n=1 Tax=Hyphomonas sp. TaxID=87 RepID=UPI0035290C82